MSNSKIEKQMAEVKAQPEPIRWYRPQPGVLGFTKSREDNFYAMTTYRGADPRNASIQVTITGSGVMASCGTGMITGMGGYFQDKDYIQSLAALLANHLRSSLCTYHAIIAGHQMEGPMAQLFLNCGAKIVDEYQNANYGNVEEHLLRLVTIDPRNMNWDKYCYMERGIYLPLWVKTKTHEQQVALNEQFRNEGNLETERIKERERQRVLKAWTDRVNGFKTFRYYMKSPDHSMYRNSLPQEAIAQYDALINEIKGEK